MCHRNSSANRFHILERLCDEESEVDEILADANCHETYPICFGDYLAIAVDRRGSYAKKASGNRKGL
jgi:hypothetical protein